MTQVDIKYKLLLVIIVAVGLFVLFSYIDSVVLSKMSGTQDFNRFGLAFIVVFIFIGMLVGIAKADC